MSEYIFFFSLIALFYAYFGYYIVLTILKFFQNFFTSKTDTIRAAQNFKGQKKLHFSIIIAAHNEEKRIISRMANIADLDCDKEQIQTIVVSDGSNDKTCALAKSYAALKPLVIDLPQQHGRAFAHNEAIQHAQGEILIFTDAETTFDKNFLNEVEKCFLANSSPMRKPVGCVTGNLFYLTDQSDISQSEGFYWKWEKKLRKRQSDLGILATGTGACLAVRKDLYQKLGPIDDCDFTTPLDVIRQGFRVLFAEQALAYDIPPNSIKREFRGRIRQTSKNFIGTLVRWGFISFFKHPMISCAIVSHKFFRWFTLYFLAAVLVSNIFLIDHSPLYQIFLGLQLAFYFVAVIGLLLNLKNIQFPIVSLVFSFCIAALGMGIGIITGLAGKAPRYYE